ncbi:MAG: hypothetical protein JKY92_05150 [Magnetovibrio sp.]|nr:hypothetical protein [Magnetovibrio sp.]
MTLVPQLDPVKTILNPDSVEFGTYASPSCLERRPYNWLDNIHIISGDSLKSADIALELGVELGSIINPIICRIGKDNFVTVLMAADMACDPIQVSKALRRPGEVVTRLSTAEIAAHTSMTPEADTHLNLIK